MYHERSRQIREMSRRDLRQVRETPQRGLRLGLH